MGPSRPPRTKTTVCGRSIGPLVHVDNRPKFGLRQSTDRFGHWTKIISLRWTTGRIFDDGPSTSWTVNLTDDGPWSFVTDGRRWTADGHAPSTSWTASDDALLKIWNSGRRWTGWTDGRKSVRGGLGPIMAKLKNIGVKPFLIRCWNADVASFKADFFWSWTGKLSRMIAASKNETAETPV